MNTEVFRTRAIDGERGRWWRGSHRAGGGWASAGAGSNGASMGATEYQHAG
jgi:hypothetical protein